MTVSNRIKVLSNATVAKLDNAPREARLLVSEKLSYKVAGYENTNLGKRSGWDGRQSFFSFKANTFPAGFARTIVAKLRSAGYQVDWVKRELPAPLGETQPVVDSFGYEDERYAYQLETAHRLCRYGQMIANLATGAGKSRVARICYGRIKRKTLFITTRGVLMHQMKKSFEEEMGEKVGVVGDGEWSPVDGFNVAMVQTLAQNLEEKNFDTELERAIELEEAAIARELEAYKRKLAKPRNGKKLSPVEVMSAVKAKRAQLLDARPSDSVLIAKVKAKIDKHTERRARTIKFLKSVEFIILEEAHEAGGDSYYRVCMACSNAYYRLSLSGTAFKRADQESNMRLMAVSGPIGITVSEKELIDKGILATPKFTYFKLPDVKGLYRTTAWQRAYKIGIVNNDYRNQLIVDHASYLREYGLTSMVLVQHKEHGELLKRKMQAHGLRVSFIYGDKSQIERQVVLDKLGRNEIDVAIGTNILDVGVDVPSVGGVFLAGGGKTEIGLRQRIGRGLRAKKKGQPNYCFVFDFHDRKNDHLTDHARARRKIVHETPGFSENVIETLRLEDYGYKKVTNCA